MLAGPGWDPESDTGAAQGFAFATKVGDGVVDAGARGP